MHLVEMVLVGTAFAAGFVDAVVGGGGLIMVPALLIGFPTTPPAKLFGTNKMVSICGTTVAAWRLIRHRPPFWKIVLPGCVLAFLFAIVGAKMITLLPREYVRPLVLFLVSCVVVYTFAKKDFGTTHAPKVPSSKAQLTGGVGSAVLGFYDGFFGPGAGSFMIFFFIRHWGWDFVAASTAAKCMNFSTNLGALVMFALAGNVLFWLGLPMAIASVLGSLAGTHFAIKHGSAFIRKVFLLVLLMLIAKLTFDIVAAV